MGEQSRRKSALAPLLAFLIPGGGHLALGRTVTGLLLLLGTLTDIAGIIRFADEGGGEFALLIILLGLGVPYFWFYSVFSTLQLSAKLRHEAAEREAELLGDTRTNREVERHGGISFALIAQGIAVIGISFILLVLVQSTIDVSLPIETTGTYLPGVLLICLAVVIVLRGKQAMFKLGRFTAAAVLVTVGSLLLWDQLRSRNDIELLGQWWPAAFVLLGIEIMIASLVYRKGVKRPSFDIGGAFIAVIVTVTAFAVTQYASMPFRWLDEFKVNLTGTSGFGEEKGFQYKKETIHEPLLPSTSVIAINNVNGSVLVKEGDVGDIVIETVMWVDAADQQEADNTAEKSEVVISGDDHIKIEAKGHPYGTNGDRKPRMNMVITLPADSAFGKQAQSTPPPNDPNSGKSANNANGGTSSTESGVDAMNSPAPPVDQEAVPPGDSSTNSGQSATSDNANASTTGKTPQVELYIGTVNGSVVTSDLTVSGGLTIKVTSGEISVKRIAGPVDAETKNGSITAAALDGSIKLNTYNGDIAAADITGSIDGSTLSGSIDLRHISGDIDTDTKNGQIGVREASGAIKADTLNGDINIASAAVGGDWDIDSSIGEIHLMIPETGSYSVSGSVTFGDVSTDLPLTISKKTIRGSVGESTYRINIDANSSIVVNRYTP
ncbi:DUF4097 family beta strand repeat-containing protein [Paenibacillus sp. R14(2021)]|uniref:DUF4097 family beta strand repeat-containing protein n=1 Tax=Paenibacillus sp. R14(2021) TaxID=2859228 RepID=UPI001C61443D|nr:DUF4097 family beta strand repeat-containing protein [Paenibacillus sp. R14(2021)]